ncbi:MAG: PilZ domain-containing protein, partial [Acidobacteriota bacterium]
MVEDDRREFQRLKLAKPILAMIGGQNALILDIGLAGALVEHYGTMTPGEQFNLAFRWHGEDIEYRCEVRRTSVTRGPSAKNKNSVSHTGVHFVEAAGDS